MAPNRNPGAFVPISHLLRDRIPFNRRHQAPKPGTRISQLCLPALQMSEANFLSCSRVYRERLVGREPTEDRGPEARVLAINQNVYLEGLLCGQLTYDCCLVL